MITSKQKKIAKKAVLLLKIWKDFHKAGLDDGSLDRPIEEKCNQLENGFSQKVKVVNRPDVTTVYCLEQTET